MDGKDPKLRQIWNQGRIPVVFRQGDSKPLLVRLPYSTDDREWLKAEHKIKGIDLFLPNKSLQRTGKKAARR
jgi:hypothetical protein